MLINSPNISGSLRVSGNTVITGSLTTSIAALGTPATTFLTSNNGTIRSRTAAQTLSDLGAQATGSYVPYTGATANVDLGTRALTAGALTAGGLFVESGPSFGGALNLRQATGFSLWNGAPYTSIYATTGNRVVFNFSNDNRTFTLDGSLVSASTPRTFTFPDATGTFALTSQIPTVAGAYLPLTGGAITGSLIVTEGITGDLTGSASTASYVEYTDVVNKPTLVSSSVQIKGYNVFATTGSNQFNGNQSITGSLTVTGQVIAQTLNVQEVTSSIVFSSGSNIFGNNSGNKHQFTGSVSVTGSLSVAGAGTFAGSVTLSGTNSQLLQTTSNSIAGDNAAVFYNSNANSYGLYIGAGSGTNHALYITDSTRTKDLFKVAGNGNVGIGTASPDVTGFGWRTLTIKGGAASGDAGVLELQSPATTGAANLGIIAFLDGSNRNAQISVQRASSTTTGNMLFYTNAGAGIVERMTITSGGAVSINGGITNYHQLSIKSNGVLTYQGLGVYSSSNDRFISMNHTGTEGFIETENAGSGVMTPLSLKTGGSSRMTITSGGNIGIGTTSPVGAEANDLVLQINGNSTAAMRSMLRFTNGNSGTTWNNGVFMTLDSTLDFYFYNLENAATIFGTNNTERMRITSGGKIEMGSTSVSGEVAKITGTTGADNYLSVYSGTIHMFLDADATNSSGIVGTQSNHNLILRTNGTNKVWVTPAGNVGIGTASPATYGTRNLDVNAGSGGNAYIVARANNNSVITELASDGEGYVGTKTGHALNIRTSDAARIIIASGGAVSIPGSLSKGSGSFKIDHPLPSKKDTYHLVHSFIEGPQADNIYRGRIQLVNGKATINLDQAARMTEGTFVLLNGNIQCFTSNESGWTAVKGIVTENILNIEAQDTNCADTISWLVIGERIDQHMLDTEWTDENGKVITEPLK
jgi:hypothetical protein